MPFKESLKARIRKRSDHACCACRGREGVDVHHIIPQEEGGSDNEENAAPLCKRCHDIFGPNPQKRKYIRECRDHWFEECARNRSVGVEIHTMHEILQSQTGGLDEIKRLLASASVVNSSRAITGRLSLGDYIRYLFGQRVYGGKFEDLEPKYVDGLYHLFFSKTSWRDDPEARKEFLERFGKETAKRLLAYVLSGRNLDLKQGATIEQMDDAWLWLNVEVNLLLCHEDLREKTKIRFSLDPKRRLFIRLVKSQKKIGKIRKRSKTQAR